MKSLYLTIIYFFLFNNVFCQNNNLLDIRNGFKDLAFGMTKDELNNLLIEKGSIQYHGHKLDAFEYIGLSNNLRQVFSINFEHITLYFDNNKLVWIALMKFYTPLEKDPNSTNKMVSDIQSLRFDFTKVCGKEAIKNNENFSFIWNGEKTCVEIIGSDYKYSEPLELNVLFTSTEFENRSRAEGF